MASDITRDGEVIEQEGTSRDVNTRFGKLSSAKIYLRALLAGRLCLKASPHEYLSPNSSTKQSVPRTQQSPIRSMWLKFLCVHHGPLARSAQVYLAIFSLCISESLKCLCKQPCFVKYHWIYTDATSHTSILMDAGRNIDSATFASFTSLALVGHILFWMHKFAARTMESYSSITSTFPLRQRSHHEADVESCIHSLISPSFYFNPPGVSNVPCFDHSRCMCSSPALTESVTLMSPH